MLLSLLVVTVLTFVISNGEIAKNQSPNINRFVRRLRTSSLYGGTSGSAATISSGSSNIVKVCVSSAQVMAIQSIQVTFANGQVSTRYGGQDGEQTCFESSCITGVSGYEDINQWDYESYTFDFVTSLIFSSSSTSSDRIGYTGWCSTNNNGCRSFSTSGNSGECLRSINLRYGTLIDSLQFVFA